MKLLLHEIATNGTVDPRVSLNRPLSDLPLQLQKAPLNYTPNKAHHRGTPTLDLWQMLSKDEKFGIGLTSSSTGMKGDFNNILTVYI